MGYYLRLKDLTNIVSGQINFSTIMREVVGFNNFWVGRKLVYRKKFKEAYNLVKTARGLDPAVVEENPNCKIKRPSNIDNITYMAMMELQATIEQGVVSNMTDLIAEIITKACYSENIEGWYRSNGEEYNKFRETVLSAPLEDMLGLYNWIDKSIAESKELWERRFFSVEVSDPDYEAAGGDRMNQFNVIATIKNICADFNCSYDEAWQKSYTLTQTNSYSKATYNHIQDQMRIAKEAKMKLQQQYNSQH